MSADNGIYIAKFSDGYRIAEAQAIENIFYFPEGTEEWKSELKSYFGESKIYKTEEEAFADAYKLLKQLQEDFIPVEYGIQFIGEFNILI